MDHADPLSALVPPLETARFLVRPVDERDLDDLLVVNGDDAVTAFLPYDTWRSMDDARAWLARMQGRVADGDTRQLVVVDRVDGRTVGALLFFKYDAPASRAELGYVVGRGDWGRGVVGEVLPPLIARVFAHGLRRLEAVVDGDNVASARVLLRLGFVHEGTQRAREFMKGRLRDVAFYGLLRPT